MLGKSQKNKGSTSTIIATVVSSEPSVQQFVVHRESETELCGGGGDEARAIEEKWGGVLKGGK